MIHSSSDSQNGIWLNLLIFFPFCMYHTLNCWCILGNALKYRIIYTITYIRCIGTDWHKETLKRRHTWFYIPPKFFMPTPLQHYIYFKLHAQAHQVFFDENEPTRNRFENCAKIRPDLECTLLESFLNEKKIALFFIAVKKNKHKFRHNERDIDQQHSDTHTHEQLCIERTKRMKNVTEQNKRLQSCVCLLFIKTIIIIHKLGEREVDNL